ncbi:uncharacterized protein LOC143020577 [Oratosquilla oratoria]|uniref:uncharacterized protein LOC143020577 n=1 Tax=Oratosquilla oratoria TaxID=337810 RepID=UPI003F771DFF
MLCRPLQLVVVVMAVAGVWTAPTQGLFAQHREPEPTFITSVTQFLQNLLNKNQQVATQINQQIQKVQNNPQPALPKPGQAPAAPAPAVPPKVVIRDGEGTAEKVDGNPLGIRDTQNSQATEGASANSKDYRDNPIMKAAMNLYIATWNYQAESQGIPLLKIDNVWPHSGLVHMPELNKFIANIQKTELVAKTTEDMKHIYSTIQEPASSEPEYTAEIFLETWKQAAEHFKAFEPSTVHIPTVNRLRKDSTMNQDEEEGESGRKVYTVEESEVQPGGCNELVLKSGTLGVIVEDTDEENTHDQGVPHQVKADTDYTNGSGNEDVQVADQDVAVNENENEQGNTGKIAGQEEKDSTGSTDAQAIEFPEKIDTLTQDQPSDDPSDSDNNENDNKEPPVAKESNDNEPEQNTESLFSQDSASAYFPKLRPIPISHLSGNIEFNPNDNQSLEQSDDFRIIEVPFGFLNNRNVS